MNETNGEYLEDYSLWLRYRSEQLLEASRNRDLPEIEKWFHEVWTLTNMIDKRIHDAKRCIDYGEEWDQ